MSQQIESDKLLVKDIFEKWYRIPEYQRPYVWDNDQVTELLDDIMQALSNNPESQYFLGSMVLQKNVKIEGETKYEEYNLLDGQQRITTLFLTTAVIRDLSNDKTLKNTCGKTIFQEENNFDNIPERLRIVFDIREQVKQFVTEFIKEENGTARTDELKMKIANNGEDISIRNMAKAILTIRKYFENIDVKSFFKYLRSNVLMIYVSANELEDAFRLFTVMNSRGIKLRNSDILKADNLGRISDNSKRLDFGKKWEDTESYFGEEFDNFLAHLRTILVKRKAAFSLLKEFEDNIYNPKEYDRNNKTFSKLPPLLQKGEETFKFINKYKNYYEQLFDNENFELSNDFELYNRLQLMSKGFESDLWIAPLLKYYDKFKTNSLLKFIRMVENKFGNDWILGLTPTERIENMNRLIQAVDDICFPDDLFTHSSLKLDKEQLFAILNGNIYGKRSARYVLLKLDLLFHGNTTKMEMPGVISIEHILPRTPQEDSLWRKNFTEEQRTEWTNRLGNLVLISRRKNSSQGNKDYADKKTKYFKNNIELFSNSIRIYNQYPTWNYQDLINNHNIVLNKIKEGFGIGGNSA
jgi:uncharacterized protein with ParB-like and HNH nuclease domain